MTKKIQVPELQRRAEVRPQSLDKKKRTIEVIFSTGARVLRRPFFDEPYWEELSLDPAHVRLDRLNNGAPFLRVHDDKSLESVLGVVESASVDGSVGTAVVRFSERPDVEPVFQDIADGILKHTSVGYKVYRYVEMPKTEDGIRVLRAEDWEPLELSSIPIGADDGAVVRSEGKNVNECTINLLEESMSEKLKKKARQDEQDAEAAAKKAAEEAAAEAAAEGEEGGDEGVEAEPPTKTAEEAPPATEEARAEGAKQERARATEIRRMVTVARLDDGVAEKLISEDVPLDAARAQVIDLLADRDQKTQTRTARTEVIGMDEKLKRMDGCKGAILHRYNPGVYQLDDMGREFRNMSLIDIAREFVEAAGIRTRGLSKEEIAKRAFNGTSDFPELLANVANKTLRDAYQAAPQTFEPIVRRTFVPDFKTVKRVQLGDAPSLEEVKENGEVKSGTIGEAGESFAIKSYAKILPITRKAIINDDLDAFTRLPELFGRASKDLEADLVWAQITGNVTMADGYAVFEASHHKNYTSSGTAISIDSLGVGRAAMRKQKGINGKPMNIFPRYLFVPASKETLAQQYCAQLQALADPAKVNPFGGNLVPIAEPRLDGTAGSDIHWYLGADKSQIDIIELASLEGQDGPVIEYEVGFEVEGMKIKAKRDVGAKVLDYRGLYMNAGA